MRSGREGGGTLLIEGNRSLPRHKFADILKSGPLSPIADDDGDSVHASQATPMSCQATSPYRLSPWSEPSPYAMSPWMLNPASPATMRQPQSGLIGSIVREQGHVYSLATSGDLLYTGSDSKNIRVWKKLEEYSGFKSGSGLVKAIVILGERIFTGHQDGKIRVWRIGSGKSKNPAAYKRIGNLPTTRDFIASSMNPKNYVEVRRHKTVLRIRHYDAVSCLSLDSQNGLLYSGSWDKTLKVWRLPNSKCLETIDAHNDAINSVVAGFDDSVFTGAADGTVKVWRREMQGKRVRHHFVQLLLKQDNAVTALAMNSSSSAAAVYCGSSDGLVNFWERRKAQFSHAGTLRGHKLAVLCLAAAGRLVFSGSADRTICVWRRDRGAMHTWLSVLTGHTGPVKCLAVEEDVESEASAAGKCDRRWILYTGSLDKSVKVWRVAEANTPAFDGYAPQRSPVAGLI